MSNISGVFLFNGVSRKMLLRFTDLYLREAKFNEKTLERGKRSQNAMQITGEF